MSHQIQVIPAIEEYFGTSEIPVITQTFTPGNGWTRTGYNKRVSRSWLRKLKREGVTHVYLSISSRGTWAPRRAADFSIEELLRVDRTPLLGGNLI